MNSSYRTTPPARSDGPNRSSEANSNETRVSERPSPRTDSTDALGKRPHLPHHFIMIEGELLTCRTRRLRRLLGVYRIERGGAANVLSAYETSWLVPHVLSTSKYNVGHYCAIRGCGPLHFQLLGLSEPWMTCRSNTIHQYVSMVSILGSTVTQLATPCDIAHFLSAPPSDALLGKTYTYCFGRSAILNVEEVDGDFAATVDAAKKIVVHCRNCGNTVP